jgi:hypothetical protein
MNWRELVISAYAEGMSRSKWQTTPVFHEPAPRTEIANVESHIGCPLPEELREFLSQTNGFSEEVISDDSSSAFDLGPFMFRASEIADNTDEFRHSDLASDIPFQEMIFIGTMHVDGICVACRSGERMIYVWYPIDQAFKPMAPNLQAFLSGWISGSLLI